MDVVPAGYLVYELWLAWGTWTCCTLRSLPLWFGAVTCRRRSCKPWRCGRSNGQRRQWWRCREPWRRRWCPSARSCSISCRPSHLSAPAIHHQIKQILLPVPARAVGTTCLEDDHAWSRLVCNVPVNSDILTTNYVIKQSQITKPTSEPSR